MDPRQEIADLILALNDICYDDDAALERYLLRLKETIFSLFGEHNPYMTCLGYLGLFSFGGILPVEESVRRWAAAKRELRQLLMVILQDVSLGDAHAEDGRVNFMNREEGPQEAGDEDGVDDAIDEPCLSSSVILPEFDVKGLPRIRIDLRDLFIMERGSKRFYQNRIPSSLKEPQMVLVLLSGDDLLNDRVITFLQGMGMRIVKAGGGIGNPSVSERMKEYPAIASAVAILADDCSIGNKEDGGKRALLTPSPQHCFEFGFLIGKFGRQNVLAVYEETGVFRRPTGFFDALYLIINKQGFWKEEMMARLGVESRRTATVFCGKNIKTWNEKIDYGRDLA